jgi:hypothetical protein
MVMTVGNARASVTCHCLEQAYTSLAGSPSSTRIAQSFRFNLLYYTVYRTLDNNTTDHPSGDRSTSTDLT